MTSVWLLLMMVVVDAATVPRVHAAAAGEWPSREISPV